MLAKTAIQVIICVCLCGCGEVKSILTGLQTSVDELKTQNNAVVQSNNEVKQTVGEIKEQNNALLQGGTVNNSGVIKYGAHVWVILGMLLTLIVFLSIPIVILYIMMRNKGRALALAATAIHNLVDPEAREAVRKTINETSATMNGGDTAKKHLSAFVTSLGVKLPDKT